MPTQKKSIGLKKVKKAPKKAVKKVGVILTGQDQVSPQSKVRGVLQEFIRNASLDRLKKLSHLDDIHIREVGREDYVQNRPWSFSILTDMGDLKVVFKCFFGTDAGMSLSNFPSNKTPDKISLEACHVLFGEFCNLVGGAIKYSFFETFSSLKNQEKNHESRIGLPMKETVGGLGFNFLSGTRPPENRFERNWVLEWKNFSIVCATMITVPDAVIKDMAKEMEKKNISFIKIQEGGDIELF